MPITKKAERKLGIYQIICKENNMVYIGSTVDTYERWLTHRWALRKGVHHNGSLQQDFDQFGESSFTFEILEEVKDKDELSQREQYFLDKIKNKYNLAPNSYSLLDYKHSKESKEKIRKSQAGENNSFYGKTHTKENREMLSKKARGENNPTARLTTEQVIDIKNMIFNGASSKEIRKKHDITPSMLYQIKNGMTWKHIIVKKEMSDNVTPRNSC